MIAVVFQGSIGHRTAFSADAGRNESSTGRRLANVRMPKIHRGPLCVPIESMARGRVIPVESIRSRARNRGLTGSSDTL